ncbi:beta transducin [Malassezia vespertilionis]|uniref:Small-subunit processome Utp12 domain-containing protein n=1 Tax=Malassezia vespertilionis TaxID=2020962 RepID=A0A2N1J9I7_9BASI|nr:beta transducin [Malassezia vespertilionis]PKI83206.1 hypothetical protein MVES_002904 [Malassezia vespertilionis]WFD07693.1 beta transducin [Malassezia vespertilionis]
MVRSYERHEPTLAFGLVSSNAANCVLGEDGRSAYVPALEDVLVWDMKLGQQRGAWHEIGSRVAVTAIARAPHPNASRFAVGYADGSIRLWDAETGAALLTFNGHQRAVTALAFDRAGLQLASGSLDTSVIVWDTVAETGLFRLKSHHGAITALAFLNDTEHVAPATYLVSTAKDGLMKLWDLRLQHNIQTVVSGEEQLFSVAVSQAHEPMDGVEGGALVVTGGTNGALRVWEASGAALREGLRVKDAVDAHMPQFITPHGTLEMPGAHRVQQLAFSASTNDTFLAASSGDRSVQVFRVRTLDEARKKQQRRTRRAMEKAERTGGAPVEVALTWSLRFEPYVLIRPSIGRVRSFSFPTGAAPGSGDAFGPMPLLCALTTNSAEIHTVPAIPRTKQEKKQLESQIANALELPGHRADVRAVALSYDDSLLASVCGSGQLKIWNARTGRCIRTLPVSAYALSVAWLPGDRYVLVGCKDGSLHSFDIPAGMPVETIEAHQGPIWSCIVHPNGQSAVTCSADKDVKFWEFEMAQPEEASAPQLSLVHVRTLKVADDVLCARFSPDGRLLAISLLDNTVKVFYADTLKFFLSLYGHKLPVLSLDISGDGKLCVTCSADKNVKIWGLDFGDCHRSIFAHDESIMGVAFEHGEQGGGLMGGREGASHRFWTVAKDGLVKYWDADRFVGIQTLEGHHGEIWALATSHNGRFLATAGSDRSIRVWEKTDEPLFLEEEREKELEKLYESAAPQSDELAIGALAEGAEDEQPKGAEATAVSKASTESLMAGERLLEALAIADEDVQKRAAATRAGQAESVVSINPVIQAVFGENSMEEVDAYKYVLKVVERIPATHVEDALLVLPFDRVITLLTFLDVWVTKEWNVSLAARILFFLLRTHHTQIVSHRVMRTTLMRLRTHLRDVLAKQKTMLGFNLAAMRYLKQQQLERRTTELLERPDTNLEDIDEQTIRAQIESKAQRKRKLQVR